MRGATGKDTGAAGAQASRLRLRVSGFPKISLTAGTAVLRHGHGQGYRCYNDVH